MKNFLLFALVILLFSSCDSFVPSSQYEHVADVWFQTVGTSEVGHVSIHGHCKDTATVIDYSAGDTVWKIYQEKDGLPPRVILSKDGVARQWVPEGTKSTSSLVVITGINF